MKGYVHVYTGDGKGKTTAAFGLALRAVGAGLKVFVAQFIKGMPYGELETVKRFYPTIKLVQFGRDCFIENEPTKEDIEAARSGLQKIRSILKSGSYDLVILDEATIATHYNLFSTKELIEVINQKEKSVEIIITGRKAGSELIEYADLVTEMNEVKHYFSRGIKARAGIEY